MLKHRFLSALLALLVQTSSAQCPCTPEQIQAALENILKETNLVAIANNATKGITIPTILLPPENVRILSVSGHLNVTVSLGVAKKNQECVLNLIEEALPVGDGEIDVKVLGAHLADLSGEAPVDELKLRLATALAKTIELSLGNDAIIPGCKFLGN